MKPLIAFLILLIPLSASAQDRLPLQVEAQTGYAGFIDEDLIDHAVLGAAVKFRLTPKLRIGPEIVWMRGPDHDRDLFLTGNLTWDILAPRPTRRVIPYLVAGGGMMRHEDRFGDETFSSWEGAATGGAGARVALGGGWYVAPEFRIGWEGHLRIGASIGWDAGAD